MADHHPAPSEAAEWRQFMWFAVAGIGLVWSVAICDHYLLGYLPLWLDCALMGLGALALPGVLGAELKHREAREAEG